MVSWPNLNITSLYIKIAAMTLYLALIPARRDRSGEISEYVSIIKMPDKS